MIDQPRIVETNAQIAAVIHLAIPRDQMQKEMGPAIREVIAAISKQGLSPQGPLFAHHLKLSSKYFDFEVGFPVGAPIAQTGRVRAGALPAARVARTIYHGGYEGLHAAWDEFGKRLESEGLLEREGLEPGATLWDTYAVGPEASSDPSQWRTELNLPLVERGRDHQAVPMQEVKP
jgi:effector-binding domain-containing protein